MQSKTIDEQFCISHFTIYQKYEIRHTNVRSKFEGLSKIEIISKLSKKLRAKWKSRVYSEFAWFTEKKNLTCKYVPHENWMHINHSPGAAYAWMDSGQGMNILVYNDSSQKRRRGTQWDSVQTIRTMSSLFWWWWRW